MLWNAVNGSVFLDDTEMCYAAFGYGPRIMILLPGLSDGLATVRDRALLLAAPYRRFFREYTVYMFSRKDVMPQGYSMRDMARDQARAMDALGIASACVVGVSQGGMIAQCLAAEYPEKVEKLVLAVTAPRVNEKIRDNVERWLAYTEKNDHKGLMVDTAEKSYSARKRRQMRLLYPFFGKIGKPADYGRFQVNAQAILSFDMENELASIVCPVLILGGTEDNVVGAEGSLLLRDAISGSQMYLYPGLGHAAFEEAKDFNDRIYAFLEESQETGGTNV